MAKKRTRTRRTSGFRRQRTLFPWQAKAPSWWTAVVLVLLAGAIILTMRAVTQPTPQRSRAQSCDDHGCQNVRWQKNPPIWQITNCASNVTSCDANGDQQICITAGRIGMCGGQQYCCPSAGAQWTTNMSACAGSPPYVSPCGANPTPTSTPAPTATPAPTSTPEPTATPEPSSTPTPTPTPIQYQQFYTPIDTPTPTPTPVNPLDYCGKGCSGNEDCPGGLVCASLFAGLYHACRNPSCQDRQTCLCQGSTGGFLALTSPSPGPQPAGTGNSLPLTVAPFTDARQVAGSQITLSGTTAPGAKVTITVSPDGVGGDAWADDNGHWEFKLPKKLSSGQKQLLVVATKDNAQGQVSQAFTVATGGGFSFGTILLIMVIIAVVFGAYVLYRSSQ
ncbi:hypothetical protein HY031_01970 [Candidatus Gottesmanbacteria bacterium]|nr:hypothetical protein [Candidatus Gottesmanbacteria bacterium]